VTAEPGRAAWNCSAWCWPQYTRLFDGVSVPFGSLFDRYLRRQSENTDPETRILKSRMTRAKVVAIRGPLPPPPGGDEPRENWRDFLRTNRVGLFVGDVLNVQLALKYSPEWSGLLAWDESWLAVTMLRQPPFATPENPPLLWGESHATMLEAWLLHQGFASITERTIERAARAVAGGHPFHRVREYLSGLVWDGKPRIDKWLTKHLGVEESVYSFAVGKNFLIAAVARAMKPGCKVDNVLIFEGKQGIRKSSLLEALAGPKNFTNNIASFGTVDAQDQCHGIWFIELQEFDGITLTAGAAKAKQGITHPVDHYRGAYQRYKKLVPRDSIMIGTCNKEQYFLDETGNRRYWPVFCEFADVEGITAAGQLWAEAVVRYKSGEHWWFSEDEEALAAAEQKRRLITHPWDERVLPYLEGRKDIEITMQEIFDGPLNGQVRTARAEKIVGAILRGEGWLSTRPRTDNPTRTRRFYFPAEFTK
jgi:putative DNA primase/helicase